MNARRFTFVLLWLALTAEVEGEIFDGRWSTPLTTIGTLIFKPLPGIKSPIWDLAVIATLIVATSSRDRVRPMVGSIKIALGALAASWVWGVVRGGSIRQTMWQLHNFVIATVFAFLVAATCKTAAHIASLGKVILFAALYRAGVLIVFYFTIARGLDPPLQTLTTHADTVLFVTGMLVLVTNAMERRTLRAFFWMIALCIPLALAIKWNNRRLAYLSFIVGAALSYYVLPSTRFKRRLNLAMLLMLPLIAAYVVIGWGHTSGMFKPVGAISTMFGTHEDTSSEMRDIENYNLIQTLKSDPIIGIGWGHEYKEVSQAISIKDVFVQYRYIPHNSVLGLLAFTGIVGFGFVWQLFVVTIFFHAISVRAAKTVTLRAAGIAGLTTVITCVVQMWGDMGWNTLSSDVLLAASVGVAVRLPLLAGAWSKVGSEKNSDEPQDAVRGEEHPSLSEPAFLADVARREERNRDGREENADDDDLAHLATPRR